ncbi:MAG: FtsQ-type POTRA domain-containing protein [Candidatus Moraniibacteriota bacterium]|nr:MAG: FtsQ-type POTRA domain-containing protein [Candidatus Moranbacteria bacterium]
MWFRFRTRSRRDQLFRQALAKEGRGTKKTIDRGEYFRSRFPYGILFLWIAFGVVLGYAAGFSSLLDVTDIVIEGNERVPSERLLDTVETTLSENYWRVVSQKNYFFIPTQELTQQLFEFYPLLETVTVEKVFPNRLEVKLTEKAYLTLWCSGGPCYTLDTLGNAETNSRLLYTLYDPWRLMIVDTSALPVMVNQPLMVKPYLAYFEALHRQFLPTVSLELERNASTPSRFSQELSIRTNAGWILLVNIETSPEEMLRALAAFLKERDKDGARGNSLTIVDMRVPGRIFYSELNQATGEESVTKEAEVKPTDSVKEEKKKSNNKKRSE